MNTCNRCGKTVGTNDWDIHTCTPKPGWCDDCETVSHCLKHGCIPKHKALEKMAQNARELGLDYEPPQRQWVGLTQEELDEMKAADPLPPSIWRYQLRKLAYWMMLAVLGMLWMGFLAACAVHWS